MRMQQKMPHVSFFMSWRSSESESQTGTRATSPQQTLDRAGKENRNFFSHFSPLYEQEMRALSLISRRARKVSSVTFGGSLYHPRRSDHHIIVPFICKHFI